MSWLLMTNVGQPDAESTAAICLRKSAGESLFTVVNRKSMGNCSSLLLRRNTDSVPRCRQSRFRRSARRCIHPPPCAIRAALHALRATWCCTCSPRWDRRTRSFPGSTGLSCRLGSSNSVSTASRRNPDTPRLYHQRVTSNIASFTAGLRQFRSGCCSVKIMVVILIRRGIELPRRTAEMSKSNCSVAVPGLCRRARCTSRDVPRCATTSNPETICAGRRCDSRRNRG